MQVSTSVTQTAEQTCSTYSIISLRRPAKILFFFPHKSSIALIVYSDGLNLIRDIVGFKIDNKNLFIKTLNIIYMKSNLRKFLPSVFNQKNKH